MRASVIVADLRELRHLVIEAPGYLGDLMAAKASGEHRLLASVPDAPADDRLLADVTSLSEVLDQAHELSKLPERATAEPALHDLLIRARLNWDAPHSEKS